MALDVGFDEDGSATAADVTTAAMSPDLVRRAAALEKWRRRSRQVHFFRKALPAAVAAILLFGLGWVGVRAIISAFSHGDKGIGAIHLINPTFYGRNEKGELYIMSASQAVRDGDDPDRVMLTNPHLLQYPAGAPAPMTTVARHGVYHEAHKLLDLYGAVVATDGRGYTFRSDVAHVDMTRNSAVGNAHVFSDGPSGSIIADAYQVYDKGQHDIFTGNVHTHLTNQPVPKAPPRPAAQPVLPAGAMPLPFKIFHHTAHPSEAPHVRPPLQDDMDMRRTPAPCAAAATLAALVLLTTAGGASALPPEPASAPTGAHMAAAPPPAAIESGPTAGLTPGNSTDPIDITSEGVEVFQPQRLTIFKGNVEETQGTQRLRTPELRVYYKAKQQVAGQPAAAAGAGSSPFGADQTGGIDHIEAAGPVYYITPTQNARGDYMNYVKDTNIITLTGHVVLAQGKSVAKGDKLVMYRNTGQNQLISDSPQTSAGRVRVILYPQQQTPPPAAKPAAAPAR